MVLVLLWIKDRKTALHHACYYRDSEFIRFLIEAAADAYVLDIEDKVNVNATMPLWSWCIYNIYGYAYMHDNWLAVMNVYALGMPPLSLAILIHPNLTFFICCFLLLLLLLLLTPLSSLCLYVYVRNCISVYSISISSSSSPSSVLLSQDGKKALDYLRPENRRPGSTKHLFDDDHAMLQVSHHILYSPLCLFDCLIVNSEIICCHCD